ncbi:MAG: hypothetical protein CVT60_01380 [Actinobacteria bacterium HGW-Actinobacteria-10]|nr:MAG: hypothetical protein CVT60_01380 [Actinobacteria bacterium HGW-Actinobacteria-10]
MKAGGLTLDARRIIRGIALAALFSTLVYAVMAAVADAPATIAALRELPMPITAAMLVLALVGFVLRALRWTWLVRRSGHHVSTADGVYLHLSGQAMGVTPGRVGEIVKPWLSRELVGMPMSAGVALLFTERVADLLGVCLLSLVGLTVLGGGGLWLAFGLAIVIVATWIAASPRFHSAALGFLGKYHLTSRMAGPARSAFTVMEGSLSWRTLLATTPVSVIAWGLEGVGFALCVHALGFETLGFAALVSVYAASTIIGAFTFFPGGIGFTELSLVGILVSAGMEAPTAAAATIVVRAATLWWGVAIGWVVLATRPKVLAHLLHEPPAES